MKKILVYGTTAREARDYYPLRDFETVGHRTYEEYGNGEEADDIIVVDAKKVKKAKKDGI